ncbi:MAG TPA: glycosyltransferase family 39 protein, partial [Stenomitos sp.]
QSPWIWAMSGAWILAITTLTLFWGIGEIGLIDETEPLFVEASRQMLLSGDWVTPYFDGETRFDKPPLIYWLMVLSFKVFGVSEWAARLPSALAAVAIVILTFYTIQQHSHSLGPSATSEPDERRPATASWLGATMLVLNLNTYFWGRTGYADMLLTTCMGGSLLAFFLGYAQPLDNTETKTPRHKQYWYWAFYVLTALAILTKGPIALLLPALIIGIFVIYVGNGREVLREMQLPWGILLICIIAIPWYVLVILANGEAFIDDFFGYHNLVRFSSVVNQHSGPWYFHFLVILAGFFPWSAYLPTALYRTLPWKREWWQQRSRSDQLSLYAWIWFAVILGFFTVSVTKYFSYTLPLMPAAAILVGLFGADETLMLKIRRWDASRWFNVVLFGGMAGLLLACPPLLGNDPWMPLLGQKIAAAHIPEWGGILWATATLVGVACVLKRSNALWLVNTVVMILFIGTVLHPAIAIVDEARQLPLRELAQVATTIKRPQEDLIMIGFRKPSLVYYAKTHVVYLEEPSQLQPFLEQSDHTEPLILTTPKLLGKTGLTSQDYQTLKQASVYTLVRLHETHAPTIH